MKMIYPERGYLNSEATNSWCCNVQIIPMRGKCRAGAEQARGRYRQLTIWNININCMCQTVRY